MVWEVLVQSQLEMFQVSPAPEWRYAERQHVTHLLPVISQDAWHRRTGRLFPEAWSEGG